MVLCSQSDQDRGVSRSRQEITLQVTELGSLPEERSNQVNKLGKLRSSQKRVQTAWPALSK